MSWSQFREWMAYAKIEPFGEYRDDLRSGVVASIVANVNRDSKKHPEPFSPSDFVLQFGDAQDRGARSARSSSRQPLRDPSAWGGVKSMFKSNAEAEAMAEKSRASRQAATAAKVAERRRMVEERRNRQSGGKGKGVTP